MIIVPRLRCASSSPFPPVSTIPSSRLTLLYCLSFGCAGRFRSLLFTLRSAWQQTLLLFGVQVATFLRAIKTCLLVSGTSPIQSSIPCRLLPQPSCECILPYIRVRKIIACHNLCRLNMADPFVLPFVFSSAKLVSPALQDPGQEEFATRHTHCLSASCHL